MFSPLTLTLPLQQLSTRFSLRQPLPGQCLEGPIEIASFAASGYPQLVARPFVFIIEGVELVDGCLVAKIRGFFGLAVVALPLVFAALATPPGQDRYNDWKFSQHIERTASGQLCKTRANRNINLSSLRTLGLEALNYAQSGLRSEERALRVCNVQLALAVAQGSPRLIDGKDGIATRKALSLYAAQKGLPVTIQDERLRRLLLEELQKRRSK